MIKSTFDQKKGCLTIQVEGRFDYRCHNEFKEAFSSFDAARYKVDLAKVVYLDSSALGMLLLLRDHAKGGGMPVRLTHINDNVTDVLQVANFHRLFDISE